MTKTRDLLRLLLPAALLGAMLAFPADAAQSAMDGLRVWATALVPTLLPYTACVLLLTGGRRMPRAAALGLCWLGGSPAGARLLRGAALPAVAARVFAAMTGTISPLFFTATLPLWAVSPGDGWLLLCVHLLAAALTGLFLHILLNRHSNSSLLTPDSTLLKLPPISVSQALSQAAQAMLTVGVCVTLGAVASKMLACALPRMPRLALALAMCGMEVASGCGALAALGLPREWLLPLLSAACGFSGLSILLQNAAFWGEKGVGLPNLLLFAAFRAALAFAVCRVILLCI